MSALGEALGGAHPFEARGKTYSVRCIDQDAQLAYARRLFQRARDAAKEMRECMSGPEYRDHLKQLNDDYIAGEYDFFSARGQGALKSVSGVLGLAAILWGCNEAEMLLVLKDKQTEVSAMIDVLLRESFEIPETPECPPDSAPATPS